MSRRLEDRIRELSARATAAKDPAELESVLVQLRLLIHQHIQGMRARAFTRLENRRSHSERAERKSDGWTANAVQGELLKFDAKRG